MKNVDWLAAGVLLIRSSVRLSLVKYAGEEFTKCPANGKQRPATLTNTKQDIFDQVYAYNLVKRSGVSIMYICKIHDKGVTKKM
jgi:hypothetical protein